MTCRQMGYRIIVDDDDGVAVVSPKLIPSALCE
jgi:hypothetical protein